MGLDVVPEEYLFLMTSDHYLLYDDKQIVERPRTGRTLLRYTPQAEGGGSPKLPRLEGPLQADLSFGLALRLLFFAGLGVLGTTALLARKSHNRDPVEM